VNQPFDMSRVQRGARLRRSPFFEATQKYGAQAYTVYNHMLFPINFDDLEAEYWKLVNDVTLWDVSVERQVEIRGPDAFAFTNLLTPRDLSSCRVGQGKYVVLVDDQGGIINDPVLLRLGENHFWLALADSDVLLWAKGIALNAGYRVEIGEPEVSPLQIQGPKSKDVIETLFGGAALALDYYYFIETELDGIPLVLTRTGWSGEVGYEIYLRDGSRGLELWDRIMDAGRPYQIAPTGPSDIRRVEAGILNYGADMTIQNNPYEVGLGWLVELDQEADFIGKAALRRIKEEGVGRKLVGIELNGDRVELNMTPWPILADGEIVGQATSVIYSPRLGKNIGYAMLPVEQGILGTRLDVLVEGVDRREAIVVRKPFIDPAKEIPKS
jgi:glycine cleavage system T protein